MRKVLFFVVIMVSFLSASETMNRIKGFLPTVTEGSTLANVINVYMKIGDWVRATNAVVKGMRNAINDVRRAKQSVEDIITTAKAMKDFNFYDMDSWAVTVNNAILIVGPYTSTILNSMGNFKTHTVDGVNDYIGALENINEFDIRDEKNRRRRIVTRAFAPQSDEAYIGDVVSDEDKYALLEEQKRFLETERLLVRTRLDGAVSSSDSSKLLDTLSYIDSRIHRIDKKLIIRSGITLGLIHASQTDTIVSDINSLLASNMVQIDIIHQMVSQFSEQGGDLMNDVRRLAEDKITGSGKDMDVSDYVSTTQGIFGVKNNQGNSIYGDHPNQAPVPQSSGSSAQYSFGEMDKAEVNTQDIIQTRNQINLILLRQEKYLRDIEAMKTNTLAYLLLIDGKNKSGKLAAVDANKFHAIRYERYFKEKK